MSEHLENNSESTEKTYTMTERQKQILDEIEREKENSKKFAEIEALYTQDEAKKEFWEKSGLKEKLSKNMDKISNDGWREATIEGCFDRYELERNRLKEQKNVENQTQTQIQNNSVKRESFKQNSAHLSEDQKEEREVVNLEISKSRTYREVSQELGTSVSNVVMAKILERNRMKQKKLRRN